jgi:hypothetical protein
MSILFGYILGGLITLLAIAIGVKLLKIRYGAKKHWQNYKNKL